MGKTMEIIAMFVRALFVFGLFFLPLCGASGVALAGDGEFFGTGIGAAVGGLIGSQIGQGSGQLVSTGIGVAAGGLIGNRIGRNVDRSSAPAQSHSYPNYYQSNKSRLMSDPDPNGYYYYTPNYVAPPAPPPTYVDRNDETYCRPYSQEITIEGRTHESYGTACLQPDGTWRIVK